MSTSQVNTHFKVVLLHSYLWRNTVLSMSIKSPNRCMGVSRLRISLFKDSRSYYPSHSTLPNTDSFIRNFSIYRVGVAKVQYLAKHIKRDKGDTSNRSAAWWNESLRNESAHLGLSYSAVCLFLCIPLSSSDFFLYASTVWYSRRILRTLRCVTLFWMCEWKIKTNVFFSVSYWIFQLLEKAFYLHFSVSGSPHRVCHLTQAI